MWRALRRTGRYALTVLTAIVFLSALVMTVLRFYVLPHADEFRGRIEAAVSTALGLRVAFGPLSGGWQGANPHLVVGGVTVHGPDGTPALVLERAEAVVAWRSLLAWDLRLRSLILRRPEVRIRRDTAGRWFVAGIAVGGDGPPSRFPEWLLAQSVVQVQDATLHWQDEARGAPSLTLTEVTAHLENRGRMHRFGLRARPGPEVATFVDLRAEFRGSRTAPWARMRGRAYLSAPYVNLGAIRQWADLPLTFVSGAGAVEAWADVAGGAIEQSTVDVRAAGVEAELGAPASRLEIPELQGRLTWLATADGFEAGARRLAIGVGGGAFLPPADAVVRLHRAKPGQARRIDIESDRLDLAPIAYVVARVATDPGVRDAIAAFRPAGRLSDLAFSLAGEGSAARYTLRSRFDGLSLAPARRVPGFAGLSGTMTADERGGTLHLAAGRVEVSAAEIFAEPLVADSLAAKAQWHRQGDALTVVVESLQVANADASVRARGSWQRTAEGRQHLDLVAEAANAEVPAVWRYLPNGAGVQTRTWLRSALVAGRAPQVQAVVQGDPARFPFASGPGRFEVTAAVEGGVLAVDPRWPRIQDIAGTLAFRGARMEITASATVLGARVVSAKVVIPDLASGDPLLEANGEARGRVADFVAFANASPVGEWIGGLTRPVKASGDGTLTLGLVLPLSRMKDARVRGGFSTAGAMVDGLVELPPLSKLAGTLEFSEKGARIPRGSAEVWGMPVRFDVQVAQTGAVTVDARGRASPEALRAHIDSRYLWRLAGETDWHAAATVRGGRLDLAVDSTLEGIASDLPAPFRKLPRDPLPVRYTQRSKDGEHALAVVFGDRFGATSQWVSAADGWRLARAGVGFGVPARLPEREAIAVSGAIAALDLDAWLAFLDRGDNEVPDPAVSRAATLPVTADMRLKTLEAFGREFHDVALKVERRPDLWSGQLVCREVEGQFDWIPGGLGRLIGRLARLHIPAPSGSTSSTSESAGGETLPAVDLTADSFRLGAMDFGRLELRAVPNGPTWQLQKLDIENPEGHLTAEGAWQRIKGKPRSQLALRLEAKDVGKLLKRLNRPEAVAGGKALLIGVLEWDGSPVRLDAPSLSGRLNLEASKGRFVQMEPGLGRLLGILSLQSLPRRLSLDFRDVFGKGYEFDEISASSTIAHGLMRTSDFKMSGSSAKVEMKGEVDIARETQNLEVRVIPSFQDSVAVGAAIAANPLAGLAALLLGRVFDNPIGRAAAFDYRVTGTWADPVFAKVPSPSTPRGTLDKPGRR